MTQSPLEGKLAHLRDRLERGRIYPAREADRLILEIGEEMLNLRRELEALKLMMRASP